MGICSFHRWWRTFSTMFLLNIGHSSICPVLVSAPNQRQLSAWFYKSNKIGERTRRRCSFLYPGPSFLALSESEACCAFWNTVNFNTTVAFYDLYRNLISNIFDCYNLDEKAWPSTDSKTFLAYDRWNSLSNYYLCFK